MEAMNSVHDDRFLVFVRADRRHATPPEDFERYLISCPTYQDARRLQREMRNLDQECVIRYLGPAGGGD
jgi:hypothetical protein